MFEKVIFSSLASGDPRTFFHHRNYENKFWLPCRNLEEPQNTSQLFKKSPFATFQRIKTDTNFVRCVKHKLADSYIEDYP